jgi:hypothetical protein
MQYKQLKSVETSLISLQVTEAVKKHSDFIKF